MRRPSGVSTAICGELRAEIVRVGWSATARLTGVDRTVLHRAFPVDRKHRGCHFETVCLVAEKLGFELFMGRRSAPDIVQLAPYAGSEKLA